MPSIHGTRLEVVSPPLIAARSPFNFIAGWSRWSEYGLLGIFAESVAAFRVLRRYRASGAARRCDTSRQHNEDQHASERQQQNAANMRAMLSR